MAKPGIGGIIQRFDRVTLSMAHDVAMAAISFCISLYLRIGDDLFGYASGLLVSGTVTFALVSVVAFWFTGLPRGVWRYVAIDDMVLIARAVTLAILLFLPAMFFWLRLADMPRATLLINWFVLFALLVAPRLIYRSVREGRIDLSTGGPRDDQVQVLIVGANDGAELFLQANRRRRRAPYYVVGILDEAERRQGRRMGGVEVLGAPSALESIVARLKQRGLHPQRLVVATQITDGGVLAALVDRAERCGMTTVRLPRINALATGGGDAALEVNPIAIEDLLGRPQTVLDRESMDRLVRGRRVLVTGAGGSIGSELVRQIAAREPAALVLLDNSEFQLYAIDREVSETWPTVARDTTIADVRDPARLAGIMGDRRPEIVFHAAALKHVPLLEANPSEGILTNAVGTRNVADAAMAAGAQAVVLISTDKAVNPTNVLGASKRVAEMLCQALDAGGGTTRFVTVRFGNVLGSSGSVVPLFQRQLAAGGPLTVTHPDIERYFMTIREAVELVLQASVLATTAQEDARGGILVLEMGEPVRIQDMARRIIRLAGRRPDIDVKIEFTGLRPGEKLYEELFHAEELATQTEVAGIKIAKSRPANYATLRAAIDSLERIARAGDDEAALAALRDLVPEFQVG
ncbi:MAG: NAD-dependent epimerase/dehydratase family protein [Alphaproteobacteria bacterium]|nr:NAD-dependent epimerase/dehydratase family protein [Alphaproteobacteria bacterium]